MNTLRRIRAAVLRCYYRLRLDEIEYERQCLRTWWNLDDRMLRARELDRLDDEYRGKLSRITGI